ncbi:MAG TPA: hypothetical protein VKA30_00975, partial [Actinomycetota bacterium]|nr:hypothetical protein [Actinomycetota bacterium]
MTQRLHIRPDRQAFDRLAAAWRMVPVWAELTADVSTPVGILPALCGDGPGVLLESVERSERWGRYSFVAGDPAAILTADADGVRISNLRRPLPLGEGVIKGSAFDGLTSVAGQLRAPRLD